MAYTYTVVRAQAPSAFLIANIGAPQLIAQGDTPALSLDEVDEAVRMIRADALAVHLNFLQESVQPEGERRAAGCAAAIARVVGHVAVPVIAKETGAGMSQTTHLVAPLSSSTKVSAKLRVPAGAPDQEKGGEWSIG